MRELLAADPVESLVDLAGGPDASVVGEFAATLLDEFEVSAVAAGPAVQQQPDATEGAVCSPVVHGKSMGCRSEAHR